VSLLLPSDEDDDDDGDGDIDADKAASVPSVDLNCRENVLTSDSDEHSDSDTIENKVFPQQRFSPVASQKRPATLRPRPIKVRPGTEVTLVTTTMTVTPSSGTSVFQPRGEVFKARTAQLKNSASELDACTISK